MLNKGSKPTMELYRPPNVRMDIVQNGVAGSPTGRLNVHAKEFTMKSSSDLMTSKSSGNILATLNSNNHHNNNNNNTQYREGHRNSHYHLQTSKSSGNILHSLQHSKSSANVVHTLQHSPSSGNIMQGPRVHFQLDPSAENGSGKMQDSPHQKAPPPPTDFPTRSPLKSYSTAEMQLAFSQNNSRVPEDPMRNLRLQSILPSLGLKRSKSLGAADMAAKAGIGYGVAKEAPDLGEFSPEVQTIIRRAVEDPNKLSARTLMELVKQVMERALEKISYALPAAKLCITVIEKEKKETFLESLLNMSQQWYQERDRLLRESGTSNLRYCAFMHFVNEMYCELKRRQLQLKTQYEGVPPGLVLLTLLYKCCQDCLKPPNTQAETDSLFFVLTSIGRDLEQELPKKLQELIGNVRDAFLGVQSQPSVKKTLLQLIELHASRWQLPASAVMYYTTN